MDSRRIAPCSASAMFLVIALTSLTASAQQAAAPSPGLDEGLLEPEWFTRAAALEFRTTGKVDYLWVKPGFELRGKRVKFGKWEAPRLPPGRDKRDAEAASEFTTRFPALLRETLSKDLSPPVVPVEMETAADVVLVGRVVDCNGGRTVGFVMPGTTVDIKVLDARTGELLAAIHNTKLLRRQAKLHAEVILKLSAHGFQATFDEATPAKK